MKVRKLLEIYVKDYFDTDHVKIISLKSYNTFKTGRFWSKDLNEFLNDEDIIVNDSFVKDYTDLLLEKLQYVSNDIELGNLNLDSILDQIFLDEEYYLFLNEINFSNTYK
jgi:hypothetical protein